MEIIKFYQEAFVRSAEKLIGIEGETRTILYRLAYEKQECVAKNLVGKEFTDEDLFSHPKLHRNRRYKVVMVETEIEDNLIDNLTQHRGDMKFTDPRLFRIIVYFMLNPIEILNTNTKLTTKEKALLNSLLRIYNHIKDGVNYRVDSWNKHPRELSRELYQLKNNLDIVEPLHWNFNLPKITSDNFLESGLKANCKIC